MPPRFRGSASPVMFLEAGSRQTGGTAGSVIRPRAATLSMDKIAGRRRTVRLHTMNTGNLKPDRPWAMSLGEQKGVPGPAGPPRAGFVGTRVPSTRGNATAKLAYPLPNLLCGRAMTSPVSDPLQTKSSRHSRRWPSTLTVRRCPFHPSELSRGPRAVVMSLRMRWPWARAVTTARSQVFHLLMRCSRWPAGLQVSSKSAT